MTLNHNCGCFSTVAGIAGNYFVPAIFMRIANKNRNAESH